jgi:hypothetical protein
LGCSGTQGGRLHTRCCPPLLSAAAVRCCCLLLLSAAAVRRCCLLLLSAAAVRCQSARAPVACAELQCSLWFHPALAVVPSSARCGSVQRSLWFRPALAVVPSSARCGSVQRSPWPRTCRCPRRAPALCAHAAARTPPPARLRGPPRTPATAVERLRAEGAAGSRGSGGIRGGARDGAPPPARVLRQLAESN